MAQNIRDVFMKTEGLKGLSLQDQRLKRDELALKREELAIKRRESQSRIQKEQSDTRGQDISNIKSKEEATQLAEAGFKARQEQAYKDLGIPTGEPIEERLSKYRASENKPAKKELTTAEKAQANLDRFKPPTQAEVDSALDGKPAEKTAEKARDTAGLGSPSPKKPLDDLIPMGIPERVGPQPAKSVLPAREMIEPPRQSVNMAEWVNEANRVSKMTTEFNKQYQKNLGQALTDINTAREMNRRLMNDPPTMNKALGNMSLLKLLTATVHTFRYADIGGGSLADTWISREYESLKADYEAKTKGLKTEQNLLSQYMEVLKDQRSAELATQATLYGVAGQKFKNQLSLATDERERKKLSIEIARLEQAERNLNQQVSQTKQGDAMKSALDSLKFQEKVQKIEKTQQELDWKTKDRTVMLGDFKMDMRPELADKVKKSIGEAGKGVRAARRIEGLTQDISFKSLFKSVAARGSDWIVGDLGKKEQGVFDNIDKALWALAGGQRTQYVGPGVLSEIDMAILKNIFNIKDNGVLVAKDFQKGLKMVISKGRGQYETVVNMLKRKAVFGLMEELRGQTDFAPLTDAQKFKHASKALGLSAKEANELWEEDVLNRAKIQ